MSGVVGQDEVISSLDALVDCEHRHHAFIFSGPRGVGKLTVAIDFAKNILNTSVDSHPDIHVIRKEDVVWSSNPSLQKKKQTSIPLDLLREKMIGGTTSDNVSHDSLVYKTPHQAAGKVFIIDEADLVGEAGQNALLKTLEEPPLNTTIILVTSRDDLLLPTVLSRCTRCYFSELSEQEMVDWIDEHLECEEEEVGWLLGFAHGSPGLAVEAVDACAYGLSREIVGYIKNPMSCDYVGVVNKILGFTQEFVEQQLQQNPNASKESLNKSSIELVLRMFEMRVRELLRQEDVGCGVMLADVLSDIESQISTHISTKVLIESLVVRWKQVFCVLH